NVPRRADLGGDARRGEVQHAARGRGDGQAQRDVSLSQPRIKVIFSSPTARWTVGAEITSVVSSTSSGSSPAKLSKMLAKQKTKNFLSSRSLLVLMEMPPWRSASWLILGPLSVMDVPRPTEHTCVASPSGP